MTTLVGKKAPDFTAPAVLNDGSIVNFNFTKETQDKYAVLFFYPLDFTFVCPSELISLNNSIKDFSKRNVTVVGVSVDSQFTHNAWRNLSIEKGGIGKIEFPLVSDLKKDIMKSYGVEHFDLGVALRGTFIIDKEGIVKSQIVNDLPIGRSVEEIIRIIDAVQFAEESGEVCPANWKKGKEGMKPSSEGVSSWLAKHHKNI